MAEARQSPNPNEITALRTKLPPQQGNTGQWGQTSQDKTWKYLCLFMSLILLLVVIISSVVLSEVLKRTKQMQKEVFQLKEKVTQGLGDAGHDWDFIRGEVFRQMKAVLAGNGLPDISWAGDILDRPLQRGPERQPQVDGWLNLHLHQLGLQGIT
ncbi:unnamed protein product [Gulo gulo]|uniref:Uncharacterized protein n=1 Tax=Gulo gulo TaxID=48420 RepID=A0A9X9PWA8_GULGU|nr:unnamed protein product [Gulo gulo]